MYKFDGFSALWGQNNFISSYFENILFTQGHTPIGHQGARLHHMKLASRYVRGVFTICCHLGLTVRCTPLPRDWRTELYWFDLDASTPISHSAIVVFQLGNGIFILEDFKTIIFYGTEFRIFGWNTRLITHLLQYACMYVQMELNVMKWPNHPVSHIVERIYCQGKINTWLTRYFFLILSLKRQILQCLFCS